MKKIFTVTLTLLLFFVTGCGGAESPTAEKNLNPQIEVNKIKLQVGEKIFEVALENNSSAEKFAEKLPLEITMNELNGNEKYYKFAENFPSKDEHIGEIHEGDLMLYNSSYVVLFYKNFSTSYNYTRLGKILNAEGLRETVGNGNIKVKFEK